MGGKGVRRALPDVLGPAAVIQRGQLHKMRTLLALVPQARQGDVRAARRRAYRAASAPAARRQLRARSPGLEANGPVDAAASRREGQEEPLTGLTRGLPPRLRRFFATTTCIENLIGIVRHVTRNATRWRDGTMIPCRYPPSGGLSAFTPSGGASVPIRLASALRAGACGGGAPRRAGAQEGVARRDERVGLRAAGVPGTVGGDDAPARNQPAHRPWRVGPARTLARASGRLWSARARAHSLDGAAGRWSGRRGGEDRQSARLVLGGPDAPRVRYRRASVSPLWRPPPPDRHAARSRGHPEDPRAPRPRPLGAESRPRPHPRPAPPRPDRIGSEARRTP